MELGTETFPLKAPGDINTETLERSHVLVHLTTMPATVDMGLGTEAFPPNVPGDINTYTCAFATVSQSLRAQFCSAPFSSVLTSFEFVAPQLKMLIRHQQESSAPPRSI